MVYIEITKKALTLLKQMDEPVNEPSQAIDRTPDTGRTKELSRLLEKARTSLKGIGD